MWVGPQAPEVNEDVAPGGGLRDEGHEARRAATVAVRVVTVLVAIAAIIGLLAFPALHP
jgi:hypothetical protein